MDFTVIKYNVESGATYWGIARDLIRQSEEYEELAVNDAFVQKIVDGLLLYRNNRNLYADTKINLVEEIEFYLNIKEVYPVGTFREGTIQSTHNDNINHVNAVNNDLLFAIKYFNTYESFAWHEFRYNGKEKYGELNIYDSEYEGARGDRTDTTDLTNGYVLCF